MKQLTLIAALVALPWLPALSHAQGEKPAAAPAAAPAAKPAAMTAEAAPVAKAPRRKRDTRDARECLQLASNTEVIKCAEKFR
jgi:hypothetical protein